MTLRWLVAVRRWLFVGRADQPMIVTPPDARTLREREWQQALDAESAVLRTSSQCRRMPRVQRAAVVERVRERV